MLEGVDSTEPLKGHFLVIIIKHRCFPLNSYLASQNIIYIKINAIYVGLANNRE